MLGPGRSRLVGGFDSKGLSCGCFQVNSAGIALPGTGFRDLKAGDVLTNCSGGKCFVDVTGEGDSS